MLEEQDDAFLVACARADNTRAFDILIERYQVMLVCIAVRYTTDREIARELVQETLLQAYLSLDRLRDDGHFKSWLFGITLNLCRRWRRTMRRDAVPLEMLSHIAPDQLLVMADRSLDPVAFVEDQELRLMVQDALRMFSPRNRVVTELFYLVAA